MEQVIDSTELRAALGTNIRRLRKAKELTQQALADKAGVTPVHLHRIEQGQSSPSAEVLFAIADALGVKTDSLRQLPVSST
jgi:transcriptional regulator with XRE-family HTH domain